MCGSFWINHVSAFWMPITGSGNGFMPTVVWWKNFQYMPESWIEPSAYGIWYTKILV
jgi:hypothetical protein